MENHDVIKFLLILGLRIMLHEIMISRLENKKMPTKMIYFSNKVKLWKEIFIDKFIKFVLFCIDDIESKLSAY